MAQQSTVEGLIVEVRSLLDENNKSRVTDTNDILPALNRAQKQACIVLAKHYPEPLLKNVTYPAGSQSILPIPKDSLEDRLTKVEVKINGFYVPVEAVSYRDATPLEYPQSNGVPTHYSIQGKNFRLYPSSSTAHAVRAWFLKNPPSLALSYGKIVKTSSTFIVMDDTDGMEVGSYVNIIDHRDGTLIGQLQVKRINGTRVEFRDTPDRSEVSQEPVVSLSDILTSDDPAVNYVKEDDYVCPTGCSNIPFMISPLTNFYVSYAEACIRRKLGEETDLVERLRMELQQEVESTWAGRENTLRISDKNRAWGGSLRSRWRGRTR